MFGCELQRHQLLHAGINIVLISLHERHALTINRRNQTAGSAKEFAGNLLGADGLKQEGIRQNKEGQAQEAEGQLKDLGKGIQDRVGGAVGSTVAGITGNTAAKVEHEQQHADGKARQRGVETDLQKQSPQ